MVASSSQHLLQFRLRLVLLCCYALDMVDHFMTTDGTRLYFEQHIQPQSKAVIIIVHGLNEHCGRYGHVVEALKGDYSVFLYDQRGHGRSEGHRSHVDRFDDLVNDLKQFIQHVENCHSERSEESPIKSCLRRSFADAQDDKKQKKIFLIGHSMGGQVVLNLLGKNQGLPIQGFITSSPNIRVALKINPFKRLIGRKVSKRLPKIHVFNNIAAHFLSHDPKEVKAYKNDPLVGNKISVRLASEILNNQKTILDLAQNINIPALMMHGGDDRICDPQGSVDFFSRLSSKDKTLKLFEGMYHEIFNEIGREVVLEVVKRWLDERALGDR